MKLSELKLKEEEIDADDTSFPFEFCSGGDEMTEEEENLTEALSQLQDVLSLLRVLDDPLTLPKGRITAFFKRQIRKLKDSTESLLEQYDMAEEEVS